MGTLTLVLTSNLEAIGLLQVVRNLAHQYSARIKFDIKVDEVSEFKETQLSLGIYQIIEQSIVNSITHGPAEEVSVLVQVLDTTRVEVVIADDDPGAEPQNFQPGLGTTMIDSWIAILSGTKNITTAPGAGYVLKVILPLKAAS